MMSELLVLLGCLALSKGKISSPAQYTKHQSTMCIQSILIRVLVSTVLQIKRKPDIDMFDSTSIFITNILYGNMFN